MNQASIQIETEDGTATLFYVYDRDLTKGATRWEGDRLAIKSGQAILAEAPSVMTHRGLTREISSWRFVRHALQPWTVAVQAPDMSKVDELPADPALVY